MWGVTVNVDRVVGMLERFPTLRLYVDDAHGAGWQGENGKGHVLNRTPLHPRMVIAVSLSKSFGCGGAALVFPDASEAKYVENCAGTFMFSGPLHPGELGAAIASADIHLSDEHASRQQDLYRRIDLINDLAVAHGVPIVEAEKTPIWFARMGGTSQSIELAARMMDDGFYVNISIFPAMPAGQGGVRFTTTLYNTESEIEALMEALGRNCAEIISGDRVIDLTELESSLKHS